VVVKAGRKENGRHREPHQAKMRSEKDHIAQVLSDWGVEKRSSQEIWSARRAGDGGGDLTERSRNAVLKIRVKGNRFKKCKKVQGIRRTILRKRSQKNDSQRETGRGAGKGKVKKRNEKRGAKSARLLIS